MVWKGSRMDCSQEQDTRQECSIHRQSRRVWQMYQTRGGQWECHLDSQCILPKRQNQESRSPGVQESRSPGKGFRNLVFRLVEFHLAGLEFRNLSQQKSSAAGSTLSPVPAGGNCVGYTISGVTLTACTGPILGGGSASWSINAKCQSVRVQCVNECSPGMRVLFIALATAAGALLLLQWVTMFPWRWASRGEEP